MQLNSSLSSFFVQNDLQKTKQTLKHSPHSKSNDFINLGLYGVDVLNNTP